MSESLFIIQANWSEMKGRILIGSLSGPNFAIRTAKMDRSRSSVCRLPDCSHFLFSFSFSDIKRKNFWVAFQVSFAIKKAPFFCRQISF